MVLQMRRSLNSTVRCVLSQKARRMATACVQSNGLLTTLGGGGDRSADCVSLVPLDHLEERTRRRRRSVRRGGRADASESAERHVGIETILAAVDVFPRLGV